MDKFGRFKNNILNNYSKNIIINISPSSSFRCRCEFSYSNNSYVMHDKDQKVFMDSFEYASKAIQKKMPILLNEINSSKKIKEKLFQINFRSNNKNEVLVTLIYHRKIDEFLINSISDLSNKIGIKIIIRSKNFIHVFDDHMFRDTLDYNNLRIYQTDNCFFQPNKYLLNKMINKVIDFVKNPEDLLELYCGVGTFTMPLSSTFKKILATENNRKADECLQRGILENKINNIHTARLSSNEVIELFNGRTFRRMKDKSLLSYNFSHILVDPPRSGLTEEVIETINLFKNVIYISCNPNSYLRDINLLNDHNVKKIEIFDQFPNTEHLEIVSLLSKE